MNYRSKRWIFWSFCILGMTIFTACGNNVSTASKIIEKLASEGSIEDVKASDAVNSWTSEGVGKSFTYLAFPNDTVVKISSDGSIEVYECAKVSTVDGHSYVSSWSEVSNWNWSELEDGEIAIEGLDVAVTTKEDVTIDAVEDVKSNDTGDLDWLVPSEDYATIPKEDLFRAYANMKIFQDNYVKVVSAAIDKDTFATVDVEKAIEIGKVGSTGKDIASLWTNVHAGEKAFWKWVDVANGQTKGTTAKRVKKAVKVASLFGTTKDVSSVESYLSNATVEEDGSITFKDLDIMNVTTYLNEYLGVKKAKVAKPSYFRANNEFKGVVKDADQAG